MNETENLCTICLDILEPPSTHDSKGIIILPCGHNYHAQCMMEYTGKCIQDKKEIACPLCRHVIIEVKNQSPSQETNHIIVVEERVPSRSHRIVASLSYTLMIGALIYIVFVPPS